MTYHYNYWSAFTEADLLKDGDHSLGNGDSFTMPGSATVTLASWDNDSQLSGDYCDKATDSDGQYDQYGWAYINNCWVKTGDLYVEKVWTLIGSDGKTYHLAEIEGEGYNAPGAGDDFFSFVGATPPAGVTLTVQGCANSSGVNYSDLSADPSEPPANSAPAFTNAPSNGVIHINENETAVIDLDASDADGDTLTFEIVGGRDAAFFEIDPHTGVLTFVNAPDYENPQSGGDSNTYDVTVKVSDGNGGEEVKPLWVKVQDVEEDTMDCIVIEAEDMHKWNFNTVHGSNASGGELVRVNHLGQSGDLSTSFSGSDGTYTISVFAQDESDGQSVIMVKVNGEVVGTINLNNDNNGGGSNNGHFSEFTIEGVELNDGDDIQLWAQSDAGEYVRIDKIKLQQTEEAPGFRECDDPNAVNIDFEGLAAGTVLGTQYDGVMISAQREGEGGSGSNSPNDAMVFDGANPTGGDTDLTASGDNVLIISEDNDSSDPDDNANGGTIWFKFDNPSYIYDIKVLDAEEGGKIRLLDENGALIEEVTIPGGTDGGIQQILLDVDGVSQIDLTLNGSGAIDDLCYVPGEDPATSSLSGKVFMDSNGNNVDDNGAEMGIAGVTVDLYAGSVAAGNFVARVETDANGNYIFENLAAGDYVVDFEQNDADLGGKVGVQKDVGDDAFDSDANTNNGWTDVVSVGTNEDVTDVDAGYADPGTASLGGRVFIDTNGNNQDDGNGSEPGVGGVTVNLLDENGAFIDTITTNADGSYLFENLPAGQYQVEFPTSIDPDLSLVSQDVGADVSDSDASQATGTTGLYTVNIGDNVRDVDAGVISDDPNAGDDAGMTCADEEIKIDVLENDSDDQSLTITEVGGQAISEGQTVNVNGVNVMLMDGQLVFDGQAAYESLDIGESATATISYTVSDGLGGEAMADVDVTFCGVAETLDELFASLPTSGTYQVVVDETSPVQSEAFTVGIDGTGDARFDGVVFSQAYCLALFVPVDSAESFADAPVNSADFLNGKDGSVFDASQVSFANGQAAADNLDLINWIINQDFTSQAQYNDWEVQRAIWELTDSFDTVFFDNVDANYGQDEDVNAIVQMAIDNGEGFMAGQGDLATMIIDPNPATAENSQPFIVAFSFDDNDCIC